MIPSNVARPRSISRTQQNSFTQQPLALLSVFFAVGIFLAHQVEFSLLLCVVIGAPSLIAAYVFSRCERHLVATALLALTYSIAGIAIARVDERSVAANRIRRLCDTKVVAADAPVELTGVIKGEPETTPDGQYLSIQVEQIRFDQTTVVASGLVLLLALNGTRQIEREYDALELRHGARVRIMTQLRRADAFRNPGVTSTIETLDRRGYDASGSIKSPLLIERLDDERVLLPLAWLYEVRRRVMSAIVRMFSADATGVLGATLLGNRNYLSQSSAERFREGGTFHVLVISGSHISIIGFAVFIFTRRLVSRSGIRFIVTILFLWSYSIAVGGDSSVVRAAVMFSIVALAPVLHRRAASLNSLGAAFMALLLWRPGDLFDPSFQLTFVSVVAIVAVAWPIIRSLQEIGTWRPSRSTPFPPACPRWWRRGAEAIYWSEKEWQQDIARSTWKCRLAKSNLAAWLERWRLQRALRFIACAVIVSTSVQITMLPFLVVYFHRLSFAAIALNVCVGVLIVLISAGAIIALMVSILSASAAVPLIKVVEALNWVMIHSVDLFKLLRAASIRLPEYSGWGFTIYVIYFIPLFAIAIELARWRPLSRRTSNAKSRRLRRFVSLRAVPVVLVVLAFLIVFHPQSASMPAGRLEVEYLDVGQGDAALVTFPDGSTMLVDGGGRPLFASSGAVGDSDDGNDRFSRDARSVGEAVVSEYLWAKGLDRVDYLLATHADADHIEGLNAVANNFAVRAALVGRTPSSDAEYERFAATVSLNRVPIQLLSRGDELRIGGVGIEVLWPPASSDPNAPSRNNDSVVLRLRYGERSILMTGDIETRTEYSLAGMDDLQCDVVKVAHHGSRTSSTGPFVDATRPTLALISVGLNSIFGHPVPAVVERWKLSGARVMTTGESGTITVSTDGKDLRVDTFVK